MLFKIDTKEKFHVITFLQSEITASMAEEMEAQLNKLVKDTGKSVVCDMQQIERFDSEFVNKLCGLRKEIYEANASFACFHVPAELEEMLAEEEPLFNIVPSETEAWDIVQMEEIERELGFD